MFARPVVVRYDAATTRSRPDKKVLLAIGELFMPMPIKWLAIANLPQSSGCASFSRNIFIDIGV